MTKDLRGDPSANNNASRIMYFDSTGAHLAFLKYYYYRQIGQTMKPGCVIRQCTTDYPGNLNFQSMVLTSGLRPPVSAVAGKNADGSWVLNVVNNTGCTTTDQQIYLYPAGYYIWFNVEELKDSSRVAFTRYLSNGSLQFYKMATDTMRNGSLLVTINPQELITFVSTPTNPDAVQRGLAAGAKHTIVYSSATRQLSFSIAKSQTPVWVSCIAYNLEGKKLSTLFNGTLQSGQHIVSLAGKNRLPRGVYLVNLRIGAEQHSMKIAM
jgi:hypothetical protein